MLNPSIPPSVNGLDVAAINRAGSASEDQGSSRVGFRVKTDWQGQTRSETTIDSCTVRGKEVPRSFTIVADEPHEFLGTNAAPNPQELLMAAFNACITVGYVAGAATQGIKLDKLEIRTSGTLDLRGFLGLSDQVAPGYENIDYEVTIAGDGTPEQFAAIHQAVMKTSPNYYNLGRPIRLNGTLHVG